MWQLIKLLKLFVAVAITSSITSNVIANTTIKDSNNKTKSTELSSTAIEVIQPYPQKILQTLVASGKVEAQEIATISSQIAGLRLDNIYVDIGDYVHKGQLLARYNTDRLDNEIIQAQATLQQAQLAVQQTKINYQRAKKLRKHNAISKIQSEDYTFKYQQAQAQFNSANAILKNQLLRKRYAEVTAQYNGTIMSKQALLGTTGAIGMVLFTQLIDDQLEWHADIPDNELHKISVGMNVDIQSQGQAIARGVVRAIDPSINDKTRQGKAYVSIQKDNVNNKLHKGMFVKGAFHLGQQKNLLIPMSSILYKDGYTYVFVVKKDNKDTSKGIILQKKVTLGNIYNDKVIVINGIDSREYIVKTGVNFLNNGDNVHIVKTH